MQGPTDKIGTKLPADKEKKYQEWRSALPKNLQYEGDYDLRGLWLDNPNVKPSANLHFTDKYKLPNHPTFSNESKYFNKSNKDKAGRWQETDSSWNYIPFNPNVKDTMVEKKNPRKNALAPDSSDRAAQEWMLSYINSPKYKERLSGFYKYPEYIQRQRAGQIGAIGFEEVPGSTLQYQYDEGGKNLMKISPAEIRAKGLNREEVVAHELGHAINANRYKAALRLSPAEESYIFDRTKIDPRTREQTKAAAQKQALGISEYLKASPSLHDLYPTENKSDVDAFRYLLNLRGIYDAGKQNITPEILKKAKSDPVIKKAISTKRLLQNFDEESLINIMNKVAINKNTKKQNLS